MFSEWWQFLALNAVVLLLAVVLDVLLPEPPSRVHPVVWLGRAITLLERYAPEGSRSAFAYGCAIVVVVVGVLGALTWLLMAALMAISPAAYVVGGAVTLRVSFTVMGLLSAADRTRQALDGGRLEEAQESLRSLVGRDPTSLTESLVAAAAIESVAENTSDSYVGPWLAFALLGVSGAVVYRAVNTLDSMIGHRDRYEYLGKAAARVDDVVNFVPARVSALLMLASAAVHRRSVRQAWQTLIRDRGLTASPNAGWTMSAMAGLLGTRLEKPGHYRLGDELRDPDPDDIGAAANIAEITAVLAMMVALIVLAARHAVLG